MEEERKAKEEAEAVKDKLKGEICVVSQTTFNVNKFKDFVENFPMNQSYNTDNTQDHAARL